jgi:hypothetical protein
VHEPETEPEAAPEAAPEKPTAASRLMTQLQRHASMALFGREVHPDEFTQMAADFIKSQLQEDIVRESAKPAPKAVPAEPARHIRPGTCPLCGQAHLVCPHPQGGATRSGRRR